MNYFFTETEQMIIDTCNQIGKKFILPTRAKYDKSGEFPVETVQAMRDAGLFGTFIPTEYGGLGTSQMLLLLAVETLSKYCAGQPLWLAATALAATPIILFGNEEQKRKYLTMTAQGSIGAFGLTEPDAGSDFMGMKTTARKTEQGYILNGGKHFITNGGSHCDYYVVFAKTSPDKGARGISAFIIDKDAPGFSVDGHEDKVGIRSSATASLSFNEVLVPFSNLLGQENHGMRIINDVFIESRPGIGAQACGCATGIYEEAIRYLKQRKQFGQPVTSFQLVQDKLVQCGIRIEAMRALMYSVARAYDKGDKVKKEAIYSKIFASQNCVEICRELVKLVGGIGVCEDSPFPKYLRDSLITEIYEGSNGILTLAAAAQLLKEY